MNGPRLHTADQAGLILQCKPSWLKDQARRRRIPFTLVSGSYHFTDGHIEEIIRIFEQRPQVAVPPTPRRRTPEPAQPGVATLRARPPRRSGRRTA